MNPSENEQLKGDRIQSSLCPGVILTVEFSLSKEVCAGRGLFNGRDNTIHNNLPVL